MTGPPTEPGESAASVERVPRGLPGSPPEALAPPPPHPGLLRALPQRAREVWRVRNLLLEFARRDVRVRYRQAVLGIAWALLMPGLTVMAGLLLRAVIHGGASGAASDPIALGGIAVKGVAWAFLAGAVGMGTTTLTTNGALVARVYFPREILPIAAMLSQGVDFAAGALTAGVLLAVLGLGVGTAILWVPVVLLLLAMLTMAVAAALACANVFFRDVRHVVQVALTFGVFFTPVFYDAAQLGARGARLVMLNPFAPLLEGLRLSVVGRHHLLDRLVLEGGVVAWDPWYLAYSLLWSVVALLVAARLYARYGSIFAEFL